jgi:HPt (histidine-containing phosphotransfer) domain-containing protein
VFRRVFHIEPVFRQERGLPSDNALACVGPKCASRKFMVIKVGSYQTPIDPDIEDLVFEFLAQRVRDGQRLQVLMRDDNYAEIQRIAHALRGSAAAYGFHRLSALGTNLETAALAADANATAANIAELLALLDSLAVEMDA